MGYALVGTGPVISFIWIRPLGFICNDHVRPDSVAVTALTPDGSALKQVAAMVPMEM